MTLISNADLAETPHDEVSARLGATTERRSAPTAREILPGVILTSIVAGAAFAFRQLPGMGAFSPMMLSMVIGIAFHNIVGTVAWAKAGITFSLRRLLRIAIILLGLQLTSHQIIEIGGRGVGIIVATLLATFAFTLWMGRLLGVDAKLAQLIAAGTSICGASAVIVTNADDEDVAYAVACVTVFGSTAMFAYPLLPGLLHLDPHAFGLWAGASIHEIAQVVAAAFQDGEAAGTFGTIAKLTRVMLLAPMVIAIGLTAAREAKHRKSGGGRPARPPMPWFVLGFVALVAVNSLITISADTRAWIVAATTLLLSIALAAMGLETNIGKLTARGFRPALLGAFASLFIAGFSLSLIKLIG
jgi:uncharacterized integral membrane protein (TIGR00698 family)